MHSFVSTVAIAGQEIDTAFNVRLGVAMRQEMDTAVCDWLRVAIREVRQNSERNTVVSDWLGVAIRQERDTAVSNWLGVAIRQEIDTAVPMIS